MARETTVLPGQDSGLLDALGAALQEQAPASLTVGGSSVPLPPELRQVIRLKGVVTQKINNLTKGGQS